jgi:hypothetical protein
MRSTLVTDGSSDEVLVPILGWLLGQRTTVPIELQWADTRNLPERPGTLQERVQAAVALYPCELLFVHRDAEREPRARRVDEIRAALRGLRDAPPAVCVVPVRMQEAWLLFNEAALRSAAGCPNGKMALDLPPLSRIERLPDPKDQLHTLLRQASGLQGRRAKKFRPQVQAHRLSELIDDFSPLRRLPAFRALEAELDEILAQLLGSRT